MQHSCQVYADKPTKDHGQQVLSDLQRVEHFVHRQLGLRGDPPHIQANTALIAQNLTSAAFRCWSWLSSFVTEPTMIWGRLHQAFRNFLSSSQPTLLTNIPELDDVWSHVDETAQEDVGEFVGHLWTTANPQGIGGKFFHKRHNGVLEEREQVPINLIFPSGHTRAHWEDLINLWGDEAEGQYLYGTPSTIILHIQRFEQHQQGWTKHHRRLSVPTIVTMPYFNDGIEIQS